MSCCSLFNRWGRDWSTRASVQPPSTVSGSPGEASESEGVSRGVRGNTESVSESRLWLDGERARDNSTALRFSAGGGRAEGTAAISRVYVKVFVCAFVHDTHKALCAFMCFWVSRLSYRCVCVCMWVKCWIITRACRFFREKSEMQIFQITP